jgi:large subunit ribosomal protein L23
MTKIYKMNERADFGITHQYDVILNPVITEKSTLVGSAGYYIFNVHPAASKFDIKRSIESLFNVKVADVNVLNRKGKKKIFKGKPGVKSDVRRAFVKLVDGQSFDFSVGV